MAHIFLVVKRHVFEAPPRVNSTKVSGASRPDIASKKKNNNNKKANFECTAALAEPDWLSKDKSSAGMERKKSSGLSQTQCCKQWQVNNDALLSGRGQKKDSVFSQPDNLVSLSCATKSGVEKSGLLWFPCLKSGGQIGERIDLP